MALLEIGRIIRPHGLAGEVVVALVTNRRDRLATGSILVGASGEGVERELEIVRSRPQQDRYLVVFAGVANRDQAEQLRGFVLRAEAVEDPSALFVHELIGAELVDQHGTSHGPIRSVQANPASDLLVVDDGFVPARFVREVSGGRVFVDVPEGLFE
jgi:16S rRNA processing protein RimM